MALWKFSNLNKYGNIRSRIIFVEDGKPFSYNPKGLGSFVETRRFKYEHIHLYAPCLYVASDGKKYILPTWQPVEPETTLSDINWIKPEVKKEEPVEKNVWKFESSSNPNTFYFVRQNGNKIICNCSGFYRSKIRKCKHVLQVEKELGL